MKSINKAHFLIACIAVFVATSCSTDFDVNAPYDEVTVVYGLLDQTQDTQFVRVNKSFLGEGNANDYALIRDSSEYDNTQVFIDEFSNSGALIQTYNCAEKYVSGRSSDGDFYGDSTLVYYFVGNSSGIFSLDESSTFQLRANINEGQKEIRSSKINLANDFNINRPNSLGSFTIAQKPNGEFEETEVEWGSSPFGKRYEAYIRFNYREFYTNGDSATKAIDYSLGTVLDDGNSKYERFLNGELFFSYLASVIPDDPNVFRRQIDYLNTDGTFRRPFDVFIVVAGEDLSTYIDVNEPVAGLVQERPTFTNIENGLGIFSSRFTKQKLDMKLAKSGIIELNDGNFTRHLDFYTGDNTYANDDFYWVN